jgi:formylglycine-generating enzyme
MWKCDVIGNIRPALEDNHPVLHVSLNDAVAYCQWLSRRTGKNYSLPSPNQWEYTARGGRNSKGYKYSGSNDLNAVAWYNGNSNQKTHPVGEKLVNELGIYDMLGNVAEWCDDWSPGGNFDNPIPKSRALHVVRGNAWNSQQENISIATSGWCYPDQPYSSGGFRVVSQ